MALVTVSVSEEMRASLVARRREADRIRADAEQRADELTALAADADLALASARIERLRDLQRQIQAQQLRMEAAYVALAEAMAAKAEQLTAAARNADFSIPAWPEGIRRTIEVRFAETREVTFRIEAAGSGPGRRSTAVGLESIGSEEDRK